MDEQLDNKLPQQRGNVQGQTAPNAEGMPLLAAGAAARMVSDILKRLSGPHAGTAPGVLRPGSLWRQVARRIGVGPQPGTGLPVQPSQSRGTLASPHLDLVWRARQRHSSQVDAETADWGWSNTPRPVTRPAASITGAQMSTP